MAKWGANDELVYNVSQVSTDKQVPQKQAPAASQSKWGANDELVYTPGTMSETPVEKSSLLRRTVGDTAVSALSGGVGLLEGTVGLVDLVERNLITKPANALGNLMGLPSGSDYSWTQDIVQNILGADFKGAHKELEQLYSPEAREAKKYVQGAEGFIDTLKRIKERPSIIVDTIAEALPSMIGAAGIGRQVMRALPQVAPLVAYALGEGAITTGGQVEQQRQAGITSAKGDIAAVTSGAATALLSVLGGKLAGRLGIDDVDLLLATGTPIETKRGIIARVLGGGNLGRCT